MRVKYPCRINTIVVTHDSILFVSDLPMIYFLSFSVLNMLNFSSLSFDNSNCIIMNIEDKIKMVLTVFIILRDAHAFLSLSIVSSFSINNKILSKIIMWYVFLINIINEWERNKFSYRLASFWEFTLMSSTSSSYTE